MVFRLLIVMACALAGSVLVPSPEATRVAFVVGNAGYSSMHTLKRNPQRDAGAVALRVGDDFSFGSSEDEKRAAELGSITTAGS
jgi:hypothetical protein